MVTLRSVNDDLDYQDVAADLFSDLTLTAQSGEKMD